MLFTTNKIQRNNVTQQIDLGCIAS